MYANSDVNMSHGIVYYGKYYIVLYVGLYSQLVVTQQTRDVDPTLGLYWPIVFDAGPILTRHWVSASCSLGSQVPRGGGGGLESSGTDCAVIYVIQIANVRGHYITLIYTQDALIHNSRLGFRRDVNVRF